MKILFVAGLGLLLGGCAILDGGAQSTADAAPAAAPLSRAPSRTAAREIFRPAYGIGRPVALVPCGKGATINDDCVGANTRHQFGGERSVDEDEPALAEAALIPVAE
jgi:hypothetical protein